jgi:hypothetical protein
MDYRDDHRSQVTGTVHLTEKLKVRLGICVQQLSQMQIINPPILVKGAIYDFDTDERVPVAAV